MPSYREGRSSPRGVIAPALHGDTGPAASPSAQPASDFSSRIGRVGVSHVAQCGCTKTLAFLGRAKPMIYGCIQAVIRRRCQSFGKERKHRQPAVGQQTRLKSALHPVSNPLWPPHSTVQSCQLPGLAAVLFALIQRVTANTGYTGVLKPPDPLHKLFNHFFREIDQIVPPFPCKGWNLRISGTPVRCRPSTRSRH